MLIYGDGTQFGWKYRYPMRSQARHLRKAGKLSELDSPVTAMRIAFQDWYDQRVLGKRHIFPRAGFGPIIAALTQRLEESGIEVWLNRRVKCVAVDGKSGEAVVSTESESVRCSKVILTSRTFVDRIVIDDESIAYLDMAGSEKWFQFSLLIKTFLPSRYCYAHVVENPVFRRVSNLTREIRNHGGLAWANEVHLVTLVAGHDGSDISGEYILAGLKSLRLVVYQVFLPENEFSPITL